MTTKEEKNKTNYYPLTPIINTEDYKPYFEVLDDILEKDEVKNIAITGGYGSGKSSVWLSYVKEKQLSQKVITVSIGNYRDNKIKNHQGKNTKTDDDKINRIERQILNQIASQVKSENIPLSKYQFIEDKRNQACCNTFYLLLFILGVFLLYQLKPYKCAGLIFILASLTPLLYDLFLGKAKISKIKLKDIEINKTNDNNDQTFFDRELREIVYILENSKSEFVVFEDLDRFNEISLDVFTKLKEINFILNERLKQNGDNNKIIFIYMVRDGLLNKENTGNNENENEERRTKFFDFILPISPIVSYGNSNEKFCQKLEESIGDIIDPIGIFILSSYFNNMRTISNIINEFNVYSKILSDKIDKDKLFYLIAIKNKYPKYFDNLMKNREEMTDNSEYPLVLDLLKTEKIDKSDHTYLSRINEDSEKLSLSEQKFIIEMMVKRSEYPYVDPQEVINIHNPKNVLDKIYHLKKMTNIAFNKDLFEYSIYNYERDNNANKYLESITRWLNSEQIEYYQSNETLEIICGMGQHNSDETFIERYIKYILKYKEYHNLINEIIDNHINMQYDIRKTKRNQYLYAIFSILKNIPDDFNSERIRIENNKPKHLNLYMNLIQDIILHMPKYEKNKLNVIKFCLEILSKCDQKKTTVEENLNNLISKLKEFPKDQLYKFTEELKVTEEIKAKVEEAINT